MIDPTKIEVWRYPNRKLFIVGGAEYATYKDIAEHVRNGASMNAVDRETGDNITDMILAQICAIETKAGRRYDASLLVQAIRGSKLVSRSRPNDSGDD